jgi:hypothetical protein
VQEFADACGGDAEDVFIFVKTLSSNRRALTIAIRPATRARLPDPRRSECRRCFAAFRPRTPQCASIEAKMPKCRRKNRQGDIRY